MKTKTLAILILLSISVRFISLSSPLIDQHGMRQTHTAITVQDWINHGFDLLHYRTPVLGSPWTLPYEFPVFQATAYGLYLVLSPFIQNLDVIMRLTSILYFYLSLTPFALLAKYILKEENGEKEEKKYINIAILLYLFLPFSIFWSRTSMIEFCALFFALSYVYCFLRILDGENYKIVANNYFMKGTEHEPFQDQQALSCENNEFYASKPVLTTCFVLIALIMGSFAYLSKATTMLPAVIFLAVVSLFYYRDDLFHLRIKAFLTPKFFLLILTAIIPVLVGLWWVRYSDAIKTASGFASLTSKGLAKWNFGGLDVRTNIASYLRMAKHLEEIMPMGVLLIAIAFSHYKNYKNSRSALCSTEVRSVRIEDVKDAENVTECVSLPQYITALATAVILAPLILFNLYAVHNYYWCAVFPFFVLLASFFYSCFLTSLIKAGKTRLLIIVIMACLLQVLTTPFIKSNTLYKMDIWKDKLQELNDVAVGKWISENTASDDKVLILDRGWSAVIPYYANRRSYATNNPDKKRIDNDSYRIMVTRNYEEMLIQRAKNVDAIEAVLIREENKNNIFRIKHFNNLLALPDLVEDVNVYLRNVEADNITIGEIRSKSKVIAVYRISGLNDLNLLNESEYKPIWFNTMNGVQMFAHIKNDMSYLIIFENSNKALSKVILKGEHL